MKQNDFYEVDGCTDFIPVKLIKEYKHLNLLEVASTESGYRAVVPGIYSFPKVNEPQKPVVPKFVAEWLEKTKNNCLLDVISCSPTKIKEWLYGEGNENEKTFIYAWLDGYEIEQEKLYTVKVLDSTLFKMTSDNHVRYKLIGENAIPLESKIGNYTFEVDLTEKEIKEADERLWQFAREVEDE